MNSLQCGIAEGCGQQPDRPIGKLPALAGGALTSAGMGIDQHGLSGLEIRNPASHLHDLSGEPVPQDDPLFGWMRRRYLENVQVGSADLKAVMLKYRVLSDSELPSGQPHRHPARP